MSDHCPDAIWIRTILVDVLPEFLSDNVSPVVPLYLLMVRSGRGISSIGPNFTANMHERVILIVLAVTFPFRFEHPDSNAADPRFVANVFCKGLIV